jgi:hypothetical protein
MKAFINTLITQDKIHSTGLVNPFKLTQMIEPQNEGIQYTQRMIGLR